jgi:polyhydroxyalkanoate synthesis repressor PhaR
MMENGDETEKKPVTIKQYANRRLYNTESSSYATLDQLCDMVKEGRDFVVYDAKTGDDITRAVLTQIILEQEGKGENLLPVSFLRQVISFYDDGLGVVLSKYLEQSMKAFAGNQEKIRNLMRGTFSEFMPMSQFEAWGRHNLAFFESTLDMFKSEGKTLSSPANDDTTFGDRSNDIQDLKKQLEEMQSRL